jgi:hypothetical protein
LVPFQSGKLHGTVQVFDNWFGQPNMTMFGHFENGRLVGPVWKLFEENGFLVTKDFDMSGPGVYIYPGMKCSAA